MLQRELEAAVGVSVGAAHYILKALTEAGLVKLGNFTANKDKRRYAYLLTRRGMIEKAELNQRFLARKLEEYEPLKAEIDGLKRDLEDAALNSQQSARGR